MEETKNKCLRNVGLSLRIDESGHRGRLSLLLAMKASNRRRNTNIFFFVKPYWKRPYGRPVHRWDNNIERYVSETECENTKITEVAQDSGKWRDFPLEFYHI
jgi:hypothetical protein